MQDINNFLFHSRDCEEGTYKLNHESNCASCEDIEWGFLMRMADILNLSYKHGEDKQSFCQRINEEASGKLLHVRPKRQKSSSDELDEYYNTIINSNDFSVIYSSFLQNSEIVSLPDEEGWTYVSFFRTLYQLNKQQIADIINHVYFTAPIGIVNLSTLLHEIEKVIVLKEVDLKDINNEVLFALFQYDVDSYMIQKIIQQDYIDILNEFLSIKRTRIQKQGESTLMMLDKLLRTNENLFKLVVERIPYYGDINIRRQVLYNLNYLKKSPNTRRIDNYLKAAREKLFTILKDYDHILKLKQSLQTGK